MLLSPLMQQEPARTSGTREPIEQMEPVGPVEIIEPREPLGSVEPIEPVEPVESVEPRETWGGLVNQKDQCI
jgi:hypothetical protein